MVHTKMVVVLEAVAQADIALLFRVNLLVVEDLLKLH